MLKIVICAFLIVGSNVYAEWKNWAKNQRCTTSIVTPKNTQELIDIVKKAAQEHKTIRAYGTGHSWSNIVCNDGYILNTDKLNNIISVDKNKRQVTVQAGIKLKDLNEQLAQHGLSLSNQGAITEQSLAGVVSTATHGSGKTGTFASFITQIQLLTADGNLKTISATQNNEFFPAVRTSIGMLGIMTELTIQCEPLFQVQRTIKTMNWQQIVQEYENLLTLHDYMQFYWYVSDNSVSVLIHDRIPSEKKIDPEPQKNGNSYSMLSGNIETIYVEEEIAIPRPYFIQAAQEAQKLVQQSFNKDKMFSGILFRFVQAEKDNILSPAADRDVVFFSITTQSTQGYEAFYKEFYTAMLKFNGRPHWGKINYLTQKDTQKLYGDNYTQFVALRKKLDPQGVFSNEFTKQVFGW